MEERELIDRAAAATATGITEFVVSGAVEKAQRVLADRDRFELDPAAAEAWDAMNAAVIVRRNCSLVATT